MRSTLVRSLKVFALAGLLAVCAAAARAQGGQRDVFRLFLPGQQRALDIDLRQFDAQYDDLPGEPAAGPNKWGRARLARVTFGAEAGKRRWPVSFVVRVEEVRAEASAESLREAAAESLLKHESVSRDSVKREAYKEAALLRYTVKGSQYYSWQPFIFTGLSPIPVRNLGGLPPKFPVLEAFRVEAGVWVWLRSALPGLKDDAKADEEALLRALLDSVRVVDTSRPATSFDFYHLGRALAHLKEHDAAAAALARSLELERERRQLGQPAWRQLIIALANEYGALDDAARARELLEYATAADPTYPYFHHGLARLHGFFGDVDKAIAALQKAYEHAPRQEGIYKFVGPYPDPLADVAFAKFKNDPRFSEAVKAMRKRRKK